MSVCRAGVLLRDGLARQVSKKKCRRERVEQPAKANLAARQALFDHVMFGSLPRQFKMPLIKVGQSRSWTAATQSHRDF